MTPSLRRSCRQWGPALPAVAVLALLLALSLGSAPASAAADGANVTAYRAPDDAFGNARAVEAAVANGTIGPADGDGDGATELVVGETLVAVIDSERLAGAMAAGNGSTTDRFLDALDGGATFRLVQTNPGTSVPPMVATVGRGNVTAHRSGTTTYVLVDTGEVAFRHPGSEVPAEVNGGERFAVEFGYDRADAPYGGDSSAPVIELYPFESRFDTVGHWYEPLPPEWVQLSVAVNIVPEDSLVARATLDGNRTAVAPVDPDDVPGLAHVWLDLRGVEPGTGYALELVYDGQVVDRYEGTVREPRATLENATLVTVGDGTAVNVTARLSHGGQVRVVDEECREVGTEWVDPGNGTRLSIELWNERGKRIRAGDGYGVLIHAIRARGASRATYPGPESVAGVGFNSTCQRLPLPWTPASTPTAQPTTASPGPSPETTARPRTAPETATTPGAPGGGGGTETGGARDGDGDGGTGTPGQPGFTALAALAALLALASLRALRP